MATPGTGEGAALIAATLRAAGVQHVFGIVGVPVIELGFACQQHGLTFFAMRNEQAASYAAAAVGYITGTPGVCVVVSGPGVVHGLAGVANARENCWPMLLIGGASDANIDGLGGFQECPQVEYARPYVKAAYRPDSLDRTPFFIERLLQTAVAGRPGPVYLDLPGNFVNQTPGVAGVAALERVRPLVPLPARRIAAPPTAAVDAAVALLRGASRPLVIVGKGAASARAEHEVRALLSATNLPFLPTPMGKGVVPDDHPQNVIAARSTALKSADVVVLLGARANWMLHFAAPPRFDAAAKIIAVDIDHEEALGVARRADVPIAADVALTAGALAAAATAAAFRVPAAGPWWTTLRAKVAANVAATAALAADDAVPMSYYRVFKELAAVLADDAAHAPAALRAGGGAFIASEGANTMDIGRTMLDNLGPRLRLDAGTFGTMGVGLGQAIAAAAVALVPPAEGAAAAEHYGRRVIAVEGDSAVGFSAMELETMARYRLPITVVVVSNCGVGFGMPIAPECSAIDLARGGAPPTSLSAACRYDKICEAVGGRGWYVETPQQLRPALEAAFAVTDGPSVVHVVIAGSAGRKTQEFDWLSRGDNAKL